MTTAHIDLAALVNNMNVLKTAAGTPVMAVVKADAYGHGAVEITKCLMKHGTEWFAVATPEEALEIKRKAWCEHILILSPVQAHAVEPLIRAGISMTAACVSDIQTIIETALELNIKAKVHLKLDTGMGRIGMRTREEIISALKLISSSAPIVLEGVFTHFATADEEDLSFAHQQLQKFIEFRTLISSFDLEPLYHAANSAGILCFPDAHFDLCRMGISLYGYSPSEFACSGDLKPVMSLHSYVSFVKEIERGDSVSYGRTFVADRPVKVATVPIGYADGYRRSLSGKGRALVCGNWVNQIGRVCMDQIMLDVTGLDVQPGEQVQLMTDGFNAEHMAHICGTISYEILTGISPRVHRVYVNG